MPGIVCAIRGGPDSRLTIERAIRLARETNLPIEFLYVVNLDFLVRTTRSRVDTISSEMEQLGEFILLAAQAEADSAGVISEGIVRHGQVRDVIVSVCLEKTAKYVVLGRPKGKPEGNVFTHDAIAKLKGYIEQKSGAQVVVAQEKSA